MTSSISVSTTFTITDAKYVGAKVGADLRSLNALYGRPALAKIDEFVEEVALLLKARYLDYVDFGFKSGDIWKLRLRYRATAGGQLADDRPGRLPTTLDTTGLAFYSHLCCSSTWWALNEAQRDAFEETLPFVRGVATAPKLGLGSTTSGHGYGRSGHGVARDVYLEN